VSLPRHIATVDADSVLVAGQFGGRFTAGNTAPRTSAGERDGFVARLSPSGDWLWSLQLGATDNATLTRIAADPKGPIWCVGAFSGTIQNPAGSVASVGGSDALLARLDLSGTWRSFQQAGGSADDHAVGLQLLPSGEPIVAGDFNGTARFGTHPITSAGASDFFVAQSDGLAGWRWAIRGGGPAIDQVSDLAATRNGTLLVAGQAVAPVTVADSSTPTLASGTAHLFVASITTNRNPTWYSTLPGVTHGQIAVGPTGKIRIAAEFNRNLILPLADGSVESFVPNAGSTDLLVAQLDPVSGAWNWARQFGGAAQDFATAIAIDADDFTTFAGTMGSSTPFGEVLLSATTLAAFLPVSGSSGTMDYNAWTIGAPVPVPDAARRADGGAFSIPLVTIRQPAGAPWTDYFHWESGGSASLSDTACCLRRNRLADRRHTRPRIDCPAQGGPYGPRSRRCMLPVCRPILNSPPPIRC
jgi:hypothetical protein